MLLSTSILFFISIGHCCGISVPSVRRDAPHSTTVKGVVMANTSDDPFLFGNVLNAIYTGTIYVNRKPYLVQLDTGSADLWIDPGNNTFENSAQTGFDATIPYGDGTVATGPILMGNVTFGDFVIEHQAFVIAPGSNATDSGAVSGLLGIGSSKLSVISSKLNGSRYDGSNFLDNVFNIYPDEPNYTTFLLSRTESLDGVPTEGGTFTIGEIVQGHENILQAPKLNVVSDFWFTRLDAILVNGQRYEGHSTNNSYDQPLDSKPLAALDTGSANARAPPYYVDAMYKDVSGAVFVADTGSYNVPCDTKLNVSIVLEGTEYYMNPLDAFWLNNDDNGTVFCTGSFSYMPPNAGLGVDVVLADKFLRNVYSLFDFGNRTKVGTTSHFIQIISVTDREQAWADFDSLNAARIQALQDNGTISVTFSATSSLGSGTSALPSQSVVSAVLSSASPAFSSSAPSFIALSATPSSPASTSVPSSSILSTPASSPSASTSTISSGADANAGKDLNLHGALASVNEKPDGAGVDLTALTRNSLIIIGLLAGVFSLLILIIALIIKSSRANKGYKPIPTPFPTADDKPYASSYAD